MNSTEGGQANINRAMEFHQAGKLPEAIALYEAALQQGDNNAHLLYLLGTAYYQMNRLPEAEQMLQRSIDLEFNNPGAHSNRGLALEGLGRLDEALVCFDAALSIKPDFSGALSNKGSTLRQLGRLSEALSSFDAATGIRPDYTEAHYNKGLILQDLDQLDAAVGSYDRAIEQNPQYVEAYCNRGNALRELGRFEEAMASYDSALRLNPNSSEASWNKAYLLLLLGRYAEGWRLYEWRRRLNLFQNAFRPQGNPLLPETTFENNPTLFIYSEQGLGDTLQFCRYVNELAKAPVHVKFQVPKVLRPLMSSLDPKVTLVTSDDSYPQFDYQTSVMSLPWVLGTSLESIPQASPYLSASDEVNASWRRVLGEKTKPRVALVRSGGSDHINDRKRSIPLDQFISILDPAFEWHSIQCEYRERDHEILESHPNIIQHQDQLTNFNETAALVEQMDLVISVDTCVAHLAGALGKPVWVLLPYVPDFRWLLEREDSPWYPTMTLYRQPRPMDWAFVLNRVSRDLSERFSRV